MSVMHDFKERSLQTVESFQVPVGIQGTRTDMVWQVSFSDCQVLFIRLYSSFQTLPKVSVGSAIY